MSVLLEVLDDPSKAGAYLVELCEYPAANPDARTYQVFRFEEPSWVETQMPSRSAAVVHGWYGPLDAKQLESLDDPFEMGYYVVLLQPWPAQTPSYKRMEVCVWRRGTWYDKYGFAKQYGNVFGWIGPFPMLRVDLPWLRQHEKEEAEDIGL